MRIWERAALPSLLCHQVGQCKLGAAKSYDSHLSSSLLPLEKVQPQRERGAPIDNKSNEQSLRGGGARDEREIHGLN